MLLVNELIKVRNVEYNKKSSKTKKKKMID